MIMVRSVRSAARSDEPTSPRRYAAAAHGYHCFPTPDPLGAPNATSRFCHGNSWSSKADWWQGALVIERGPTSVVGGPSCTSYRANRK